jgi:hypothetical protein
MEIQCEKLLSKNGINEMIGSQKIKKKSVQNLESRFMRAKSKVLPAYEWKRFDWAQAYALPAKWDYTYYRISLGIVPTSYATIALSQVRGSPSEPEEVATTDRDPCSPTKSHQRKSKINPKLPLVKHLLFGQPRSLRHSVIPLVHRQPSPVKTHPEGQKILVVRRERVVAEKFKLIIYS